MAADSVDTPFRITIPSGTSTFTIKIPNHHLGSNRQFYFQHLNLAPDFFSLEAEKLKLDTDPDLDQIVESSVQVKINHVDPKTAYAPTYQNASATTKTIDFMDKINDHFELNKPEHCYTTPFFIDWIDEIMHEEREPKKYVTQLAQTYYSEAFYEALHGNRLPNSVQELDGVNNYLPPIGTSMSEAAFNARIRLRIWMAPYTKAIFSSNTPYVTELGFTLEQFGEAQKQQYHIVNDKAHWLPVAIATKAPKTTITKTDGRITVSAVKPTIANKINKLSMVKRDWLDDAKLSVYLRELFNQVSRSMNTNFSLSYIAGEKKYQFYFPSSGNIEVLIVCQPELAIRLGFESGDTTIFKGMKANPQRDRYSIDDAQRKALALVYDTGPLVCTLDQVASNRTSGALDLFMAALYPNVSGILSMPQSVCSCASNAVHLNAITQSSAAHVPITFRLLRIYDDEKIADFSWKNDSYVYGTLQGICNKQQKKV